MIAVAYYLNPDGSLRTVEKPDRCRRYWQMWRTINALQLDAFTENLSDQREEVDGHIDAARMALQAHMLTCDACRSWVDESNQAGENLPSEVSRAKTTVSRTVSPGRPGAGHRAGRQPGHNQSSPGRR